MALIQWENKYSVKVKELDAQHQRLVSLINELHDAMRERKTQETLKEIINGLAQYTQSHFKSEEKLFDTHKYPYAPTHVIEHQKFIQKISEFKTGFEEGRIMLSMDVMNFLKDWLINHIQGTDQKYSDFLNEKGVQ